MRGAAIAVVGGSIAGCAAARALSRAGAAEVTVFERTGGALRDRGVGLGLQNDRFAELAAAGYVDPETPWVRLSRRVWTVRDGAGTGAAGLGRTIGAQPFPFRSYDWGSLWNGLRRRVPADVDYRAGAAVTAVEPEPGGGGVSVTLDDGRRERFDAVIGADGYRSVVRAAMFPGLAPEYAGYVGWRGTAEALPAGADEADAHMVVFPGGQCILYLIPAPGGGTRLNWVLYATPPTDQPADRETGELAAFLRGLVTEHFPPRWAATLLDTPVESTFVQPIHDLSVPHYAAGRLLLLGDAATVARPHIGSGAVKALQDATALESAWHSGATLDEVVATYDAARTPVGTALVALARRFGRAQLHHAPDWASMTEDDLSAWWRELNQGSDSHSGFGGHALRRDARG
jgi:2-polyprenyl-6-methoxyphenol hydroxylase-like FAD-dependent oxidoreductase